MSRTSRCIVEVALNGITAKEANPNVPRAPTEIAEDALRCVEAGASIIHNHTEDSLWDPPDRVHAAEPYIEAWTPVLAAHPDALTYPTMGSGGPGSRSRRTGDTINGSSTLACCALGWSTRARSAWDG
jgi:uncharacterized protein (DUF849 family)